MEEVAWSEDENLATKTIKIYEDKGFRMLHYDRVFGSIRLTFTNDPEPPPEADPMFLNYALAATIEQKVAIIARRLGLIRDK